MARRNEPPARTRIIDKMEQGIIDFDVLMDIPSVKMKEDLAKSIQYIKEYAAKKGLSEKETKLLIEAEILTMRYSYLDERNADNLKSGSYEAIRDINANNREMNAIGVAFDQRHRQLGNILNESVEYVNQRHQEQENKKGRKKGAK